MKRLIFRLSSFGDVILAQSALESTFQGETHWVVAAEYKDLLIGNPKVSKVWEYNRKTQNLMDWIRLCKQLSEQNYDVVLDLHASLRTILAHGVVWFYARTKPKWKTISKERLKRLLYITLKNLCPKDLRPTHYTRRVCELSENQKIQKADMLWLVEKGITRRTEVFRYKKFITLMPSSAWPGKEWPTQEFVKLAERLLEKDLDLVVLGSRKDHASQLVYEHLKTKFSLKVIDGIDQYSYAELAYILSKTKILISNDTGFAHLAESLDTPVAVIYGPTTEDFGFGIKNVKSIAMGSDLWCRPCSKDGTWCFRKNDKYLCIKQITHTDVMKKIQEREYV